MVCDLKNLARDECKILDAIVQIDNCKIIVGYFNRSGLKSDLKKTTKQEVPTRWNSQLEMLESMQFSWDKIKDIVNEPGCPHLATFNAIDKNTVDDSIDFLEPFEVHTKELEGHLHPTIQKCCPAKHALLAHCRPCATDSELVSAIKEKARYLIQEKIVIAEEHKLALFLWPSMNELNAIPTECERKEVHAAMRRKALGVDAADIDNPDPGVQEGGPTPAKRRRADPYASLKTKKNVVSKDEIDKYLEMTADDIGDDEDLLEWWRTKGTVPFPKMSKVAMDLLAIPGSSAPCETIWSDAGRIDTDERSSMKMETLENNLVLRHYLRAKRSA
ncbi:uncharacterized protein LOC127750094 [Frankliniella occidentalis]|uniref:Uncharacterized protein LOC127750094 n=1 Tax=Frankliniella occidentalis TaxID=133901 RepID=A0A9C6U3A5_FRAOC|nr:uncharacterized protein LOC127750094 [Frankliniella occidentalis]